MNALKRIALATVAATMLSPLGARAVDITVRNDGNVNIHPYYRSNCWDGVQIPKTTDWVFFGTILRGTQFTWGPFEDLMDWNCAKPVLELAYVEAGQPLETLSVRTIVPIRPTRASDAYLIRLGTGVMVKDVQLNGLDME
jgi:hypothetical protein